MSRKKFGFQAVEALLPYPNLSLPKNCCHFMFMVYFPAHVLRACLPSWKGGIQKQANVASREMNATSFLLPSFLGSVTVVHMPIGCAMLTEQLCSHHAGKAMTQPSRGTRKGCVACPTGKMMHLFTKKQDCSLQHTYDINDQNSPMFLTISS